MHLTLLAMTCFNLGSVPAEPSIQIKEAGLLGTWTLMHVEWMGQKTDQAFEYSDWRLEQELGCELELEGRYRITFRKDRLILHGGRSFRNFGPDITNESAYRFERQAGRTVLHIGETRSLIAVSQDTLWICHHMGNQVLPKSVAGDPNDEEVVVLVYRRGDFARRIVRCDTVRS